MQQILKLEKNCVKAPNGILGDAFSNKPCKRTVKTPKRVFFETIETVNNNECRSFVCYSICYFGRCKKHLELNCSFCLLEHINTSVLPLLLPLLFFRLMIFIRLHIIYILSVNREYYVAANHVHRQPGLFFHGIHAISLHITCLLLTIGDASVFPISGYFCLWWAIQNCHEPSVPINERNCRWFIISFLLKQKFNIDFVASSVCIWSMNWSKRSYTFPIILIQI